MTVNNKTLARKLTSLSGWKVNAIQDRAAMLYCRADGASSAEIRAKGLNPCLNMVNAPVSHPVNQTISGRGHMAWSDGDKGKRRYYIAFVLNNLAKDTVVPSYAPKTIMVSKDGETVEPMTAKDLRQYLKTRDSK